MPGSPCLFLFFYEEEYKILLLFLGGEREQEIFKEYVNGMESEALTFKTDEDKEKFVKEMTDLAQMEVDVDAEPVHIPLSMDMALTADDIGNLIGFVEFDEE